MQDFIAYTWKHTLRIPWAGSLVRIGHRPPEPVVGGSNPSPPANNIPSLSEIRGEKQDLTILFRRSEGDAFWRGRSL